MLTARFSMSVFSCGNLMAVSCQNGTLYLVQKLTLNQLQSIESYKELSSLTVKQPDNMEDTLKAFVTLSFSPTGCSIFAMDNAARITILQVLFIWELYLQVCRFFVIWQDKFQKWMIGFQMWVDIYHCCLCQVWFGCDVKKSE